ncbi:putative bifunctional phosphoribosyl-AMP cyclohydrolase/phosphoribosyl-ATP pyrophosphatase [Nitrospira tepida]|uniref:Histidine biosynthesis bifunctional protein HisIE n=2 Tax=Nitrospira tepida TaxID=2973512 RepID=A0AA86MXH4_9BACT|nr:putative bifunctional phosphoribosyl-AMP cyclohydrolase/phosphoribosyl-ATP pyrophosphatase [Nitrospira tepida]
MQNMENMADGEQEVQFDDRGLIPAIVQDWRDGSVLMLGYMNREALDRTRSTRSVHFWSRSRQRLWEKGETSGHRLIVKDLFIDCDQDTILVKAEPVGPTCHTGKQSCFFTELKGSEGQDRNPSAALGGILERIAETVRDRRANPRAGSYVSKLLEGGPDRFLKKVVEEAGEVLLAGKNAKREEIVYEVADLLFHTLIVLEANEIPLSDVYRELAARHGKSGLRPAHPGEGGAGE